MGKLLNEDQIAARLESALYAAGRPLTVEELIKATGTESRQKTLAILESIIKKMKNTFKAIEIVTLPDGSYVFQLKPEYSASIRKYASKPLLSRATHKTLSYISTVGKCGPETESTELLGEVDNPFPKRFGDITK